MKRVLFILVMGVAAACAQETNTPVTGDLCLVSADNPAVRWKSKPTPADFLTIAGAIPPGSSPDVVEERLGPPLAVDRTSTSPLREFWLYFQDDRTTCSVEFIGDPQPAGFRGASINVVPKTETAASAQPLTEERVTDFLKAVDEAVRKMDSSALLDLMSGDVAIRIQLPATLGSRVLEMNRQQYENYLKEAYLGITEYQYERDDSAIKIAEDGKSARASHKIIERSSRMGQHPHTSESVETAAIEMREGKLVITRVEATVLAVK